jgi:hypothetical protein
MSIWYKRQFGTIYGHLVQFMAIWYNLWPFGTIYGHLEQYMAIWYIFGMFNQYKSGNPGRHLDVEWLPKLGNSSHLSTIKESRK